MTVPVTLPEVPRELMRAPGVPRCALPKRDEYDAAEVLAYARCYEAAYHSIARRLLGLQRAVEVREAEARKVVAASKKL